MVRLQSVSSVLLVVRLLKAIMIICCRPELSESKNICIMHNVRIWKYAYMCQAGCIDESELMHMCVCSKMHQCTFRGVMCQLKAKHLCMI